MIVSIILIVLILFIFGFLFYNNPSVGDNDHHHPTYELYKRLIQGVDVEFLGVRGVAVSSVDLWDWEAEIPFVKFVYVVDGIIHSRNIYPREFTHFKIIERLENE